MSYEGEDRRKSNRLQGPRRTHDLLEGVLTEEERQQCDKMMWSERHYADKTRRGKALG